MPPADEGERLVLDTNVFVAAGFHPGSASAAILQGIREGRWRLVWDDDTRRETLRILSRIPPLAHLDLAGLFRPEDRYAGRAAPERLPFIEDPDDRKFAALAEAAGAILITSDEHLLSVRDRLAAPVLTPIQFIEAYAADREGE